MKSAESKYRDWELAALDHLLVTAPRPLPEKVWIEETLGVTMLCYGFSTDPEQELERTQDRWVLDEFLQAARGEGSKEIVRFAERYGALRPDEGVVEIDEGGLSFTVYRERLELWLKTAHQVKAVIEVAARLHLEESGTEEQWQVISGSSEVGREAARMRIGKQRWQLGLFVSRLLYEGGVRFLMTWRGQAPKPYFHAETALGAIAAQLALQVGQVNGLAFCGGCGEPFVPRRKPRIDQQSWCVGCKEDGADRRNARLRYNARKRDHDRGGSRKEH